MHRYRNRILVLVLGLLVVSCGDDAANNESELGGDSSTPPPETSDSGRSDSGPVQEKASDAE